MRQDEPRAGGLVSPTELIGGCGLRRPIELIEDFPGEPLVASDPLRWVGLEALRYRDQPPNEAFQPPLTYHSLLMFLRTQRSSKRGSMGSAGSSRPRPVPSCWCRPERCRR